jgi:hypothetical protein
MNESELATLMATVRNIEKEVAELKVTVRESYQTKEGSINLRTVVEQNCKDIKEIQGNLSKAVWIVLSAVMTAVIYLVIRNGGG